MKFALWTIYNHSNIGTCVKFINLFVWCEKLKVDIDQEAFMAGKMSDN